MATVSWNRDVECADEGWNICDCDGSANGPWQIQRLDAMEAFPDDEAAWAHVVARALSGSELHRAALDFVREHNPLEWQAICRAHPEVAALAA